MAGINKVILVGRLGKDPEVRTAGSSTVTNFSMATSETWKDKVSGEKQEKTEWHNIVAWRGLGDVCGKYLSKGSQVYIEGRLQTREWEDTDGNRRFTTEVVAQNMQMLDSKKNSGSSSAGASGYQAPPEPESVPDDTIPF